MRIRWLLLATLLGVPWAPLPAAAHEHGDAGGGAPASGERRVDVPDPDSGVELVGKPAPEWIFRRWARGGPLTLEGLRGRVVLMRFWTEGCRFCEATLPAIERLRTEHAGEGLVVLGAFHPPRAHQRRSDAEILAVADRIGFGGPVAVDQDWRTLGRYWLDGHPERNWVSASFLIDRRGIIRWVHGGGEYHPNQDPRHARCDVQFHDLEKALAAVLAEPAEAGNGEKR